MQMVVPLRAQYRMAADIMLLANTIVYDGQLRCGADHVAEAVLDLQVAPSQIGLPQWLTQVSSSYHTVFAMSLTASRTIQKCCTACAQAAFMYRCTLSL